MKTIGISLMAAALLTLSTEVTNAQARYRTALGLGIDVGDGPTLVGPQVKHFFDGQNAGNAQVLFADNITILGVDYSYNQAIRGTNGLNWYVGVGPQLTFIDRGSWDWDDDDWRYDDDRTYFAIRPALGLEYTIPSAPLGFHFDWKPWWNLSNNSSFEPARFTLGFKFTFK